MLYRVQSRESSPSFDSYLLTPVAIFYVAVKTADTLFSSMKRMFYPPHLTIAPSKAGVNSLCAPGIQGSKRCSWGLIESQIAGRKSVFHTGNLSMKRVMGIVKMLCGFSRIRYRKRLVKNRHVNGAPYVSKGYKIGTLMSQYLTLSETTAFAQPINLKRITNDANP